MRPGTVAIVGGGPGDPELLTVKARRRIDAADVILHDALVGDQVVESLPQGADVVDVGKTPDGERTTQAEINRRLVAEARRGHRVVRLKGGDPTIFGRGGEEAEYLADHGVDFEFVPGISSAVAGPQAAGIPLTHREHASSVTVVTGHEDPSKPDSALDWSALARTVSTGGTLVILMGVGRLPENVAALRANDLDPATPVAMVERATLPGEFTVADTLAGIVETARAAELRSPAVTVVGDVVAVGTDLATASAADAVRAEPTTAALEADGGVEDGGRPVPETEPAERRS